MHDWLYEEEPPLTDAQIREFANANLPASGGLNLLLAAAAALICANTRLAPAIGFSSSPRSALALRGTFSP
jgi:hypothetical protein